MQDKKWLYDIGTEEGNIILDNGEMSFNTKEEAIEDALKSITEELCNEYNTSKEKLVIKCYIVID